MYDNTKFGEKPMIQNYKAMGVDMVRVPYDLREISPGIYSWREISVKYNNFNYGGLVSALIGLHYTQSEMTAVINNYLLDPEDEATKAEFIAMQECRKEAKEIANRILNDNQ